MSLDHALSYQRRGWVPVPTFEVRTRQGHLVCSCPAGPDCPSPAKHPRVAWRHLDRLDPAQVQAWWRRWPSAGIALRTGQVSGLVVVDVDPGHGGSASLDALTEGYGPLPPTLSVSTGGGGWHHYFAAPGLALPNDAGRVLGAGLDVRAEGGIVVAPPTRHLSGQRYAWATTGPPDPTPLPTWIAERLSRPPPRLASLPVPAVEPVPARAAPYGRAALARECQAVRAAGEGTRNATLNRAAFR
ncbi:MAG: bifunctional DNA primase/polymerase, partial [Acidimicrobiales bacterium]